MSVNLGPVGNAFIAWWNGAGLAWKFTVVLGALIALVVVAAVIKLIIDKIKLRRHVKRERREKAAKEADAYAEEIAIKRLSSLEEGDLFGVRAIQSGYYGGVAQSAPSSPVGSRAPSLYNQPTTPSGPLNGSSPYMPLMHPQAAGSTASLPRSPLGLNPIPGDARSYSPSGPSSPIPNAMVRDSQRPTTSGSNRGFERPPLHARQNSGQSSRTINLDGLAPNRQQNGTSSLRPSASDASDNSPPSTNNGTSHGSRSSSFTSTYSFEEGIEQQPQNPKIVKPFEGLPTLPVLQPLTAEVHNVDSRRPSPAPMQEGPTSPPHPSGMTAELPADIQKSPPRKMNFSTPFRRPSQPDHMVPPLSPGFGPLPAAAMNGGPQQFVPSRTQSPAPMNGGPQQFGPSRTQSPAPTNSGPQQFGPSRTQSPAPMNRGPGPQRTDSPGPFPIRGASTMDRSMSPAPRSMSPAPRTMSPGPRNQMPPRQGQYPRGPIPERQRADSMGSRRPAPSPLQIAPNQNKQPSLPAFLQGGINSTELDMPQYPSNEPRSAPPTQTSAPRLMPEQPKKNRLTADILGDFYDSYSYTRSEQESHGSHQHHQQYRQPMNQANQQFEMQRMGGNGYPAGSQPQQIPVDRRLI